MLIRNEDSFVVEFERVSETFCSALAESHELDLKVDPCLEKNRDGPPDTTCAYLHHYSKITNLLRFLPDLVF